MLKITTEYLEHYYKLERKYFKEQLFFLLFSLLVLILVIYYFYSTGFENIHTLSQFNFLLHSILLLITSISISIILYCKESDESKRKFITDNLENIETKSNLKELNDIIDTYEYRNAYKRTILNIIAHVIYFIGFIESIFYITKMLLEATYLRIFEILAGILIIFLSLYIFSFNKRSSNMKMERIKKQNDIIGKISLICIALTIVSYIVDSERYTL